MNLKSHLSIIFIAVFLFSFTLSNIKVLPFECPLLLENEVTTQHLGYITSYNHTHHQPNWVAYTLTQKKLNGVAERTNKFLVDPLIHPETCNTKDYSKSGFDRGHLAPAADMTWSKTTSALFIVTGPILKGRLTQQIGKTHKITVPNLFFKAIVDTNQIGNGIAFVIQNEGSSLPLSHFAITIDSLEKLTGRDFFHNIPQKKQANIEKKSSLTHWKLNN